MSTLAQGLPAWAGGIPNAGGTIDNLSASDQLLETDNESGMVSMPPVARLSDVSTFSDVQPGDWAYEALRSLIQRYGVLEGYSDGSFRGDRAVTRYEFISALTAVLAKVEQLYRTGERGRTIEEDLLTLQQLQTFYDAALGELKGRLSQQEDRQTQLEAKRFSATSQLQGQVILAGTGGVQAKDVIVLRSRLNLVTSFSGTDQLVTQLEMGNDGEDAINFAQSQGQNLFGTNGSLVDGGGLDYAGVSPNTHLYRLYYQFQPLPSLQVAVGPKLVPSDFIDRNSFANNSAQDFGSSFFINNPLIVQNQIDRLGGAGVALTWQASKLPLKLRALYAASDAENPGTLPNGGGLFGDRWQGTLEAEFEFQKGLIARFQYTTAQINQTDIEAAGINVEWAIDPRHRFAVFGRFGVAEYSGFNSLLNRDLDLTPKSWSLGVVVRNLWIPGTLAGFAIGQPFVEADLGDGTQTNLEAFIQVFLNDRISITPSVMLVTNANNNDDANDIWQGTIRTVFSF
jgi:hypothetical protein